MIVARRHRGVSGLGVRAEGEAPRELDKEIAEKSIAFRCGFNPIAKLIELIVQDFEKNEATDARRRMGDDTKRGEGS